MAKPAKLHHVWGHDRRANRCELEQHANILCRLWYLVVFEETLTQRGSLIDHKFIHRASLSMGHPSHLR